MIMTKENRIVEKSDLINSDFYAKNRKQIRKELMEFKKNNNKYMASDCPLAGKHLKQLEADRNIISDEALHPIELLAKAYKL